MSRRRLGAVAVLVLGTVLLFPACSESTGKTISAGGIAWSFSLPGAPYGRIEGATVSVLEMPELQTTTNENGEFTVEGLPVGLQATFKLEHDNHPVTHTKTFTLPDTDIVDLTFQIPSIGLYNLIAAGLGVEIDETKCQMVSTFTRFGKTIGDVGHHGQAGAILISEPADTWEWGPIYFGDDVLPAPDRVYSSLDGGVLIVNVDPGDYTWTAACVDDRTEFNAEYPAQDYAGEDLRCADEDVQFETILLKCRPNVFINASPSYGLQALE